MYKETVMHLLTQVRNQLEYPHDRYDVHIIKIPKTCSYKIFWAWKNLYVSCWVKGLPSTQILSFLFDFRNRSVFPINQFQTCLRYYASAGHLTQVADFMGMDTSTASRIFQRVSGIIAGLFPNYIKMPDAQHILSEQNKFYDMVKFPRVLGIVDGTHICIQSPGM